MTSELVVNGYKLLIHPVSPLAPKAVEMRFRKQNPEPKPPTYTFEAVAGIVETVNHTKETVETDEEKIALLAYETAHQEWMGALTYKLLRLFLSQGVKLAITKKQKSDLLVQAEILEIDIPENETELDLFLLETFIITSQDLVEKLIKAVLEETGIKEEALDAATAMFPD